MGRIVQLVRHRSLTASIFALFFGLVALAFIPEHSYRLQQQGADYLRQAGSAAFASLVMCIVTLLILLRDSQSSYPSFRCSLATLLWALACVPVVLLSVIVVKGLLR